MVVAQANSLVWRGFDSLSGTRATKSVAPLKK